MYGLRSKSRPKSKRLEKYLKAPPMGSERDDVSGRNAVNSEAITISNVRSVHDYKMKVYQHSKQSKAQQALEGETSRLDSLSPRCITSR